MIKRGMNATTAELALSGTEPNQKMNAATAGLARPEAESNQNRAQIESITLVLQIALLTLVLCCSRLYCKLFSPNQIESTTMHVPQSNHTTPLTPRHMRARTHLTHILEGVRACGKAVPGRHSRLCQSNTSAHPEVTCKGTTTINQTKRMI